EASPGSCQAASDGVRGDAAHEGEHQHRDADRDDRAAEDGPSGLEQQIETGRLRCEDLAAEMLPVLQRVQAGQIDAFVIKGARVETTAERDRSDGREAEQEKGL